MPPVKNEYKTFEVRGTGKEKNKNKYDYIQYKIWNDKNGKNSPNKCKHVKYKLIKCSSPKKKCSQIEFKKINSAMCCV